LGDFLENNNIKKFMSLWEEFTALLERKNWSKYQFAQEWDKFNHEVEDDFCKVNDKLKNWTNDYNKLKENKSNAKRIYSKKILKLEEYIKFLDEDRINFEAFDDEKFGNLF